MSLVLCRLDIPEEFSSRPNSLERLRNEDETLPMIAPLKRFIVLTSLLLCGHSSGTPKAPDGSERSIPNIIFIMADDMGYGDPSCYGGKINTPNLDKMAKEGLRFTDFHSTGTVCSPSRAGLLTGRYQQRAGIDGVISADPESAAYKLGLDPQTPTFLNTLSEKGYKTGVFGKWHLGYLEKFQPMNYGIDTFVGFVSGNIDYHSHYDRMETFDWWHNRKKIKETGYSTHLITEHTIRFIEDAGDKPFCIYVAHEAVHSPLQGPQDPIQRGPDKPKKQNPRPKNVVFTDMLLELDKSVGQIIDTVKEAGLEENTLIMFTSDNGPMPQSSPGPLRGRKGSIYEGGHRVPTIAWWPKTIAANSETAETAIGIDIFPTLLELTNISSDKISFDGTSLLPVFKGGKLEPRKLYWRNSGLSPSRKELTGPDSPKAVRDGPWKLVASPGYRQLELFNLDEDLGEKNDLSKKFPERTQQMMADLKTWEAEMIKSLPYKITDKK
ncbi:MAG: sulfatase-like hydrolase/transferase [Akkermansiaceae bacterium]